MNVRVLAFCCMLLPATVLATTWGETKIIDPVSGGKCSVKTPHSSGSYVYHWPEKYDQVFWPFTDPDGIWVCPKSGFVSFIGDIELTATEKTLIGDYLKGAGPLPKNAGRAALLARLESIQALRNVEPDAKSRILRALAYQHEAGGSQVDASRLRAQAAVILEARLADQALEPLLRLQYMFVTANYARELGRDVESDAKLETLALLLADAAGDEKVEGYAEYLRDLIPSARKIAPGGVLAPGD